MPAVSSRLASTSVGALDDLDARSSAGTAQCWQSLPRAGKGPGREHPSERNYPRIISGGIAERKAERRFNKPYSKTTEVVTNLKVEHRTPVKNLGDFAKADRPEMSGAASASTPSSPLPRLAPTSGQASSATTSPSGRPASLRARSFATMPRPSASTPTTSLTSSAVFIRTAIAAPRGSSRPRRRSSVTPPEYSRIPRSCRAKGIVAPLRANGKL